MVRLSNTPRARLRGLLVFTIAVAQAAILLGPARYTLSLAEDAGAAAKSTPSAKPKSIQLEGQGALVPTGSCSQTDCAGEFTASLTAPLFGYSNLDFDLDVSPNPVAPGSSCYQSTGDGALGDNEQFNVGFAGQLCTAFYTYTLQGTLEVAPRDGCHVPQRVMVGTLAAYGAVHQSGPVPLPTQGANPIPSGSNSGALVSIAGAIGQIPAPCPSP